MQNVRGSAHGTLDCPSFSCGCPSSMRRGLHTALSQVLRPHEKMEKSECIVAKRMQGMLFYGRNARGGATPDE